MDWYDVLIKIGVGACLGFGIITLAKLGRKKIDQDRNAAGQCSPERTGASCKPDNRGETP